MLNLIVKGSSHLRAGAFHHWGWTLQVLDNMVSVNIWLVSGTSEQYLVTSCLLESKAFALFGFRFCFHIL